MGLRSNLFWMRFRIRALRLSRGTSSRTEEHSQLCTYPRSIRISTRTRLCSRCVPSQSSQKIGTSLKASSPAPRGFLRMGLSRYVLHLRRFMRRANELRSRIALRCYLEGCPVYLMDSSALGMEKSAGRSLSLDLTKRHRHSDVASTCFPQVFH